MLDSNYEKTAAPKRAQRLYGVELDSAPHQRELLSRPHDGEFVSVTIKAAGERNSITPGATHVTWTRLPGLNPARSSQRPMIRILGLMRPFQGSPSGSIFNMRPGGCGSARWSDLLSCITLLSVLISSGSFTLLSFRSSTRFNGQPLVWLLSPEARTATGQRENEPRFSSKRKTSPPGGEGE
jgi:hypothetical protein